MVFLPTYINPHPYILDAELRFQQLYGPGCYDLSNEHQGYCYIFSAPCCDNMIDNEYDVCNEEPEITWWRRRLAMIFGMLCYLGRRNAIQSVDRDSGDCSRLVNSIGTKVWPIYLMLSFARVLRIRRSSRTFVRGC
jgi:hypothetical protein